MTQQEAAKAEGEARVLALRGMPVRLEPRRLPRTAEIFARAAIAAFGRSQGALDAKREAALAPIEVAVHGVRPDPERVAKFRAVCGVQTPAEHLPLSYPECLFLGLMAEAVLCPAFPFSPFGLIHMRQGIEQYRPIRTDETLDLLTRLAEVRQTDKGYETDFSLEVTAAGELAWRGVMTILSRNAATRGRKERGQRAATAPEVDDGFRTTRIDAPENTGRRYAAASDDWNPHHLTWWTARPVGYKRPIAHGMWTLARTLSEIESDRPFGVPTWVEASFKKPILLPGAVELRVRDDSSRLAYHPAFQFEVREPKSGAPHMVGGIRPI
ncbi:MAG: hypothetical protein HY905_24550 [Deltaproteobacteria bacterium]|nr:hypothetical protein [Deltaproteobacteria bacterium]